MTGAKNEGPMTAVLGPTNTGKTFLAIERMLGHATGMIGFPLRLLARENYDKVVEEQRRFSQVALVTGEEKDQSLKIPATGSARSRPCRWTSRCRLWRSTKSNSVRRSRTRLCVHRPPAECARHDGNHVHGLRHHGRGDSRAVARLRDRNAGHDSPS